MILGLDIGSSSVKALRVDERGRVAGAARRSIVTRRPRGDRVEHDAEGIYRAAVAALREAGAPGRDGAALGIATQRSTILFWDRATGRPLTPAWSWQDRRGAAWCARLVRRASGASGRARRRSGRPGAAASRDAATRPDVVAARTGLRLSPHYSASKLAWGLRHVPGLARKVARGEALWGTLGTFLAYRMSDGALYAIDHANAQRTLLFDIGALAWDPGLFRWFGLEALLEAPALPALVPTVLRGGLPLRLDGGAVRLAAMTGDQQAALVGLGCRGDGDMAINYGSGAFVLRNAGDDPLRVPGLLTTLLASWTGAGERGATAGYAVEGTVNAAATAIDWAERRLRLRLRTRAIDAFLGPDDGRPRRVHFLPAVAGVGAPRWDQAARPRFAGDLRGAGRRDLMRAVVESIALRCAEIVRAAEKRRPAAAAARAPVLVAGGLTRIQALLQAQADLLQRPLLALDSPDATGVGAALHASVSPEDLFGRRPEPERRGRGRGARSAARPKGQGLRVLREPGRVEKIVLPRISADEAEARFRAWSRAVYGRGGAGRD